MISLPTRNIWIFGGTGYIGQALLRHLSASSNNHLHLLIHRQMPFRYLENYHTFTGSLSAFDPYWFDRFPPDVVFHLARPAGSSLMIRHLSSWLGEKANNRLVRLLSDLKKPPVVVYVSGSLVYGEQSPNTHADEKTTLRPTAFARFYFRNERPWMKARDAGLLDVRFARPGWILGPASWFKVFFWDHYLNTGKVPCYGNGEQLMSLVHIDDCVAMINNLSLEGKKNQTLNIYSGSATTQIEFAEQLATILNAKVAMISLNKAKRRYGKTTAQALTSSIPMQTLYKNLHQHQQILFPDIKNMLVGIVSLLKNK
jgi:nucleoside-diphosphate-sugar epimerase